MAPIKSRKRHNADTLRLTGSAAATLLAFAVPSGALAQQATPGDKVMPTVNVAAPEPNEYKPPETLSSPKYTAPLLDTPQTITVIPRRVIEDQNLQGLREILATVPGITFGAGEGGGGFGDSINIRGFSGSNDITIDGVRDSGQYTRSDTFNIEQVEVINGANSVFGGAGSVGGSVNLVTKAPRADNFAIFSGGLGTDSYSRGTADINRVLNEDVAFRLNLMVHDNDAPGRDHENFSRWGVAPSVTFGLNDPTNLTLSYFHQEDDNLPQYGVPYANGPFNNGPLPGVDNSNYYGYRNVDTQEIEADAFQAILNHEINENFSLRNLTRWQRTTQFLVASALQGQWCLENGTNPFTGGGCTGGLLPGFYRPSGPRGNTRDTENTMLYNQFDLTSKFNTGSVAHTLVTGFSVSHEEFDLLSGNSLRRPDGSALDPADIPDISIRNPDSIWRGPVNFISTSRQEGEVDNHAIYAFDRAQLNQYWELNGGLRYERNEGEHRTDTIALPSAGGGVTRGPTVENNDDLVSYRLGVVFKPQVNGSIYAAYGNAETPSKASVNGSCNAVTNCSVDPEESETYELGTKWDLLDKQLNLTASIFRNTRKNYRVADPGNPDNPSGIQQLDGRARVDGFLLGVAGLLAKNWSIFANYAYLDSEVLQGASDYVSAGGGDVTKGDPLTNVPKHSASLWTTYDLSGQWQFGYGVTYVGKMYVGQSNNFPGDLPQTDSYFVHRMMAAYKVNRQLRLQLNVENLFDEEYYERIRNNATNGWATPGAGRFATLTAIMQF